MTVLDAGSVVGRVWLDTASFDRVYTRTVGRMSELGGTAERSSKGVTTLDRSFVGAAAAADKAAVATGRAAKSTTDSASASERAVAVERQHALAIARVSTTMGLLSESTTREQAAVLRAMAAQERYDAALTSGTATTRQLATAQATLIGAERSVVAAQEAAAASSRTLATAQGEAAVASRGAFAGSLKMAGELGLLIGAVEGIKKAIDITKEANDFQRAMVQVQTNADVSAAEVNRASGALLAMAGPVAAAPADLATAWYHAKSVGLDYAKSIDTTRIAAEDARVGHANLEETMNALTSTVASGIPGVKDMSSAMGQLIAIVGSGDMKLSDLNQFLGSGILSVVKGYGLSLTDVGAAAATFGDNNIRGAEAATMLRMAVQAMAVPAVAGRDKLRELGLTVDQLAKDMQSGGLNKAILDLKAHLDSAGVSSTEVGAVLTEVFGKRAGPGLAVLLGQTDRLESKFRILKDSGASFADKWKATTQTASFALASLGHRLEALGITLTAKLGPSVATAATWLGVHIPAALHTLAQILGPTVHLVGEGLGGAFHLLGAALGPVASALGAVGGFLADNRALVTGLTVTVLSLWAAFKLVTIARVAIVGMVGLINRIGGAVEGAGAKMATFASVGKGSMLAVAGGLGLLAIGWQQSSQIAQQEAAKQKAIYDSLASAIDEDNGRIGEHTQKVIFDTLAQNNAATIGGKYKLSMEQLSSAVKGNTDLFDKARTAGMKYAMDTFDIGGAADYLEAIDGLSTGLKKQLADYRTVTNATRTHQTAVDGGTAAVKAAAAALGVLPAAYLDAQGAAANNTDQTRQQTLAFQLENDAASLLQQALNGLAGTNLDLATARTQVAASNLSVAASFKQNGSAIDGNSKKAVANQQAIQGQVQSARQLAEAVGKSTHSTKAEAASLTASRDALLAQLKARGELTPAVKRYVDKLYDVKGISDYLKAHPTKLDADPKPAIAKTDDLQKRINAIRQGKVPGLSANSANGRMIIAELQAAINALHGKTVSVDVVSHYFKNGKEVPAGTGGSATAKGTGPGGMRDGWSTVGEEGGNPNSWELVHKQGSHVDVFSNKQSKKMTGWDRVPGFAGGTGTGKALDNDATKLARLIAQMVTIDSHGQTAGQVAGVSDIRSSLQQLEQALKSAGVPSSFISGLARDNNAILHLAGLRNAAARGLAAANARLLAAKQVFGQDRSAFSGAVVGSFDVSTAGTAAGGPVTGGSIMAEQRQAVTRAHMFVAGLKRLIGKRIFPGAYVRALAGKGPDALPEVQALLSLSASDLRTLAAENSELNKLGGQIGQAAAVRLDQPAITRYRAEVADRRHAEAVAQKRLEYAMDKFASRVEAKLHDMHIHGSVRMDWPTGSLSVAVKTDENKTRSRR